MRSNRKLIEKSYILDFENQSNCNNYTGGRIELIDANCPCCGERLIQYLHLDLKCKEFSPLRVGENKDFLILCYCMRCSMHFYDFQYRILTDKNKLEIVLYSNDDDQQVNNELNAAWLKVMGNDPLRKRHFGLMAIPQNIERLWEKYTADCKLLYESSKEERQSFKKYWDSDEDLGGPCQIGGTFYLLQDVSSTYCHHCEEKRKMIIIATLANRASDHYFVSPDEEYQIIFSICKYCGTVGVRHSCS